MAVVTTLNFAGRTEEALALYERALGSKTVYLMRFKDSPDQTYTVEGREDLIFHATFIIGDTEFMASDVGHETLQDGPVFEGFAFALNPETIERGQKMFDMLSEEGTILIPLSKSKFTGWYGIVQDKFGVMWKINVAWKTEQD